MAAAPYLTSVEESTVIRFLTNTFLLLSYKKRDSNHIKVKLGPLKAQRIYSMLITAFDAYHGTIEGLSEA